MTPTLPPWPLIDPIIDRALAEDLAGGDLTSEACVDASLAARGVFVTRSELIVSGLAVAARVFHKLDMEVTVTTQATEGARVSAKTTLMEVRGRARSLLAGEPVALNLLQRMCGVATITPRHLHPL